MFVIFRNPNDYFKIIFDNYENEDVLIDKDFRSRFLSFIECLHTSIRINRKWELPLKKIWYFHYLDYKKIKKDESVYFIFFEGARVAFQRKYIEFLKRNYPYSKFIFRFVNPVNAYNEWMLEFIKLYYDLVITMDISDSKKYHWLYVNNTYNIQSLIDDEIKDIDVFFVGSNKGRLEKIIDVYRYLVSKGVTCEFFIADVKANAKVKGLEGIHFIKKMNYKNTLKLIARSKCLLEIVQEGQNGSTLRSMESLVYRKKLLTNDKSIKDQEYFDKNNIFIFENVKEIDVKFITDEVVPNEEILKKISHDALLEKVKIYFNID